MFESAVPQFCCGAALPNSAATLLPKAVTGLKNLRLGDRIISAEANAERQAIQLEK